MKYAVYLLLALATVVFADPDKPKDGRFLEHHANGEKRVEGFMKDGQAVGAWKWYYDNGKVKKKGRYLKGELRGDVEVFNKQGRLIERTEYRNSKRHGNHLSQQWSKKKDKWFIEVKTTGTFHEDKPDGRWETVYHNGRKIVRRFKRGKELK